MPLAVPGPLRVGPTPPPSLRSEIVSPTELAAEFHQLRELAPAFGVRTLRQSIERAAKEAIACGDPETRELAERVLKEVRKSRFP